MKLTLMHSVFYLVAGDQAYQAEQECKQRHFALGGKDVVQWQQREGRAYRSVELVDSIYGFSVRASSGLDGFALLAGRGTLDGSLGDAAGWAEQWVSEDPLHRYAFIREYDLKRAGIAIDSQVGE